MVLLYSLLTAALIVTGQALWKAAVTELGQRHVSLTTVDGAVELMKEPKLLIGVIVYIAATAVYIFLLSKFNYFQVQSIVLGSSLILTLLVAVSLFGEKPSIVNVAGMLLLVIGSVLVIYR